MTVIELLEQYVGPFLQACATLFILLITQRISGQIWIEPLASTMRIIIILASIQSDEVVQDEE